MKTSPLLISFTLVTSLSLLNISSALSAVDQPEKPKAVQSAKAKAKAHKAKTHKAKTAPKTAAKSTPVKLASADTLKFAPIALAPLTTNPYLASQPLAILPKAMNPYSVNPGITVATPTPPVASLPVLAVKHVVPATPVVSAPITAAPVVAPVASAAPTSPVQVAPAVVAPVLQTPVVAAASTTNAPAQTVVAPLAAVATPTPIAVAPIVAPIAAAPIVVAPIANPGWNVAPVTRNPYASSQQPLTTQDAANLFNQFGNSVRNSLPAMPQLSSLTPPTYNFGNPATAKTTQASVAEGAFSFNQIFSGLKGLLPQSGDSVLPVIKTVYPTGEKPLVVINFKCPTEVIGISTPPMKLLHELLNYGFDGLNKTNLLSFNLQQVCS